ncbi:MAG: hypothetical protein CL862_11400 [Cyanobium sp. NAT70]|nr:hypothetical protein [Cyanobium sp. NAT70]
MPAVPVGVSLLFGSTGESSRIKQRKKGGYQMVIRGVEEIEWFTDRPVRSEGSWRPSRIVNQWSQLFKTSDPNAKSRLRLMGKGS